MFYRTTVFLLCNKFYGVYVVRCDMKRDLIMINILSYFSCTSYLSIYGLH